MKYNYQGLKSKENTSKPTLLYNDRKKRSIQKKLYLRAVVFLDNKSTMDLFYNPYLVEDIKKVRVTLRIQSNGGEISVNKKSKIHGYNRRVWFSRRDITTIIFMKKIT